jgi:hypothetical protein
MYISPELIVAIVVTHIFAFVLGIIAADGL